MQVKIGEKIKELRKRDGRKQEDLANALGVTAQAVSRWEAGACYPDVSLIPAIANYFHVAIDALFGYSNDRETKIREYAKAADRYMIETPDDEEKLMEIITLLRKGLEEFPDAPELQRPLALTLSMKGTRENFAATGDFTTPQKNCYLEEAAGLYEKLAKENPAFLEPLMRTYASMGEYDKAEKKALEQPRLTTGRELLLASIYEDERGKRYRGEAILALLHELGFLIDGTVVRSEKTCGSKEGLAVLSSVVGLYQSIFSEKDYGKFHSDLCMLNLSRARIAAKVKDQETALACWNSAFMHYKEHVKIMNDNRNSLDRTGHAKEECFTSPLLSEVRDNGVFVVICRPEHLRSTLATFPKKLQAQIKKDPAYAELNFSGK